jgi:hypothetical protein
MTQATGFAAADRAYSLGDFEPKISAPIVQAILIRVLAPLRLVNRTSKHSLEDHAMQIDGPVRATMRDLNPAASPSILSDMPRQRSKVRIDGIYECHAPVADLNPDGLSHQSPFDSRSICSYSSGLTRPVG